jgi:hypothetical protein
MSLARKLSYIRAASEQAIRDNNQRMMMDLMVVNLPPMLNALDKLEDLLRNFEGQHWAKDIMEDVTNDFGEEPPPDIVAS